MRSPLFDKPTVLQQPLSSGGGRWQGPLLCVLDALPPSEWSMLECVAKLENPQEVLAMVSFIIPNAKC